MAGAAGGDEGASVAVGVGYCIAAGSDDGMGVIKTGISRCTASSDGLRLGADSGEKGSPKWLRSDFAGADGILASVFLTGVVGINGARR